MGLSASIPMIMKEKGASYQALSVFSLVSIPFSLKLLWAPLVDSLYISRMGRRKTWLIPVQLLCGFLMLYASHKVDAWMQPPVSDNHDHHSGPDVQTLTAYFMALYFLMATQDIAVDGWALTMLSRRNVGYASTCNAIGQVLGFFFANQGFIVLSDAKWCQNFLGLSHPLFDLSSFMAFWGVFFIVVTLVIWIAKAETALGSTDEPDGIYDTYRQMWSISKLKNVRIFILVLMTSRVALAPVDSVSMFKMQEYGTNGEFSNFILMQFSLLGTSSFIFYSCLLYLIMLILLYCTYIYIHNRNAERGHCNDLSSAPHIEPRLARRHEQIFGQATHEDVPVWTAVQTLHIHSCVGGISTVN
mgnify:CR=1 FL=1